MINRLKKDKERQQEIIMCTSLSLNKLGSVHHYIFDNFSKFDVHPFIKNCYQKGFKTVNRGYNLIK